MIIAGGSASSGSIEGTSNASTSFASLNIGNIDNKWPSNGGTGGC